MNKIIYIVLMIIVGLLVLLISPQMIEGEKIESRTINTVQNYLPVNQAWPTQDEIKTYITQEALRHGINPTVALRIANCESGYSRIARNPNSTATGIYQFLTSTWENYCIGNRLNPEANIDCFMDNYIKHKSWWVCK
jgi:hypothetical protein